MEDHLEWLPTALRELLADARILSLQMDIAEALGWVVVSKDEENGSLMITGPLATPEEALIEASRQHQQVNAGLSEGELGWTHTVWPLFSPSRS